MYCMSLYCMTYDGIVLEYGWMPMEFRIEEINILSYIAILPFGISYPTIIETVKSSLSPLMNENK